MLIGRPRARAAFFLSGVDVPPPLEQQRVGVGCLLVRESGSPFGFQGEGEQRFLPAVQAGEKIFFSGPVNAVLQKGAETQAEEGLFSQRRQGGFRILVIEVSVAGGVIQVGNADLQGLPQAAGSQRRNPIKKISPHGLGVQQKAV